MASTHFGHAVGLRAQRGPAQSIRTHSNSSNPAMMLAAFACVGVLIPSSRTISCISSPLTPAARARFENSVISGLRRSNGTPDQKSPWTSMAYLLSAVWAVPTGLDGDLITPVPVSITAAAIALTLTCVILSPGSHTHSEKGGMAFRGEKQRNWGIRELGMS